MVRSMMRQQHLIGKISREAMRRAKVSRWRLETNQVSRWTATALLHVERGFHRIKGHADLPQLLAALARP